MRGRKLLSLVLCAALTLALAVPAAAAGEVDDQALTAVTARVKETLGLDTQEFDDFQGWAEEDALLGTRWSLEWRGDGVQLSITADGEGKIYSYNRYGSVDDEAAVSAVSMGGRLDIPRLPEDKSEAAYNAAVDFLGRVLETGLETVELENTYTPSLRQSSYSYSGEVLLNGLGSPITCSVTVRASDLAILRYRRSDRNSGYLGEVPGADTTRTEAQARSLLRSTIDMTARYVLEPDGKTALVRYVPLSGDSYYVDAKTGQLEDLTELYEKLWANGGSKSIMFDTAAESAAEAQDTGAANGLTQAEKDGAAILAGALSKEELDTVLKNAWPEMGLGSYTLSAARYSVSEREVPEGQERTAEDYSVTCRLTYSREEGQTVRSKYVTVEAKTGQLKSLYSSRSYRGEGTENYSVNFSFADAQTTAQTIIKAFAGTRADALGLADCVDARAEYGWEHLYCYQQTAGGYFYPGNYYTVGIDATDGAVSRIDSSFDDDVVLQVPDKVITKDQAIDAYLAAMAVPYGYLEVPVSIDLAGDLTPLLKEAGYSYVLTLKNGYTLSQPKDSLVEGIYAESGEAAAQTFAADVPADLTYDDLAGHWVQTAADALARFGVGLRGGSLKPDDTLTQLDMVALLASVDGYTYDPASATQETTDRLYEHAYSLGLVTPETRDEDRVVTRGELVRLILDAAGYERVAALPGIFRCDFSDAESLTAEQMGYAALAQGLGLVNGGSNGAYAPDRQTTRAEALAMLYQYMK